MGAGPPSTTSSGAIIASPISGGVGRRACPLLTEATGPYGRAGLPLGADGGPLCPAGKTNHRPEVMRT
jgi:hypothetical protein